MAIAALPRARGARVRRGERERAGRVSKERVDVLRKL